MAISKFDTLWRTLSDAESEEVQTSIMKDFMLNSSLEELLAWNQYLAKKGDAAWAKHRKTGLSEADKIWYQEQFAQFDALEAQIKQRKAA